MIDKKITANPTSILSVTFSSYKIMAKTTASNKAFGDMPHSLEAEQSVLGAVLVDPEQINQVADMLKPEFFYLPEHQSIFAVMLQKMMRNERIDFVTVLESLKAEGFFSSEDGKAYLLLYSIQRAEQGFFASDTNIPAFAELSYAVLRIKPEENGIFTYHDLLIRKVAYLYDSTVCPWEQNAKTLYDFLDELNALTSKSIMLVDTSLGELWINTDGEAITLEVNPMWLFGDFEFTLDEGFTYDRSTLEVTAAALTVRSAPNKPAEGEPDNAIGYLAQGDYIIRLATGNGWSMVLYDGQIAFVSSSYVRDCLP